MEISVHESSYALPYRFFSVALALGSQRLVGTGPFQLVRVTIFNWICRTVCFLDYWGDRKTKSTTTTTK